MSLRGQEGDASTRGPSPSPANTAPAAASAAAAAADAAAGEASATKATSYRSAYSELASESPPDEAAANQTAAAAAAAAAAATQAAAGGEAAEAAAAAADLAAYRQLHRERYAERLLKETEDAEALRRQQEEQMGVELARRLQQEELDRLAMDLAARQERERQLLEARFAAAAPAAASAAAAAAGDAQGGAYGQAPSGAEGEEEDCVRAPLRTNYAERLLEDGPPHWNSTSSRSQRLLGAETQRADSAFARALRRWGLLTSERQVTSQGGSESSSFLGRASTRQLLTWCLWLALMSLPLAVLIYVLSSL